MRLFPVVLFFTSAAVMAQGSPCAEPEYAFTTKASKTELRDKYCYFVRRAKSNDSSHRITQEAIQKKGDLGLSATRDREVSMDELKAAGSCRVAAGAVADALSRRFKSKPPASCD